MKSQFFVFAAVYRLFLTGHLPKALIACMGTLVLCNTVYASSAVKKTNYTIPLQVAPPYAANIPDSASGLYYKLALTQVLSEICPSMLTVKQQAQFNENYQNQLRVFMPESKNPSDTLKYLASQKEYRDVLQGIRNWTKSFPPSENKAVCQEFASASTSF